LLPAVYITNMSGFNLNMRFTRLVKDIPNGWTSCFCYPQCISPTRDTLSFTVPGNSTLRISPNFGTDSIPGFGKVILVLSVLGSEKQDTLTFTGSTLQTAGINTNAKEKTFLYPNPTSDVLFLNGSDEIQKVWIYNES